MGRPLGIEIDPETVGRLVRTQHPDLAALPVVPFASGWDNALFRLGGQWLVRLPRRAAAALLIEHEQRWLPQLQDRLPLAVPAPVRTGVAQDDYPWSWSIVPWIAGDTADLAPPDADQGEVLGLFFNALHVPAPLEAPLNPYRGVPLAQRADTFHERVAQISGKTDLVEPMLLSLWDDALAADPPGEPTWIHGDPHPRNVLVAAGRLTGVIDWGDMARGDRAADLASVWMLLPALGTRERAMRTVADVSADTWRRARGWALFYAVILLRAGLTNDPCMAPIAERTLRRLRDGPF